jgi:hypothetical protein
MSVPCKGISVLMRVAGSTHYAAAKAGVIINYLFAHLIWCIFAFYAKAFSLNKAMVSFPPL